MDGSEASATRADSILMTTAVHAYSQSRNPACSAGANTCSKLWANVKDTVAYIADPERFTLLVDHSLVTSGMQPADMKGFLFVGRGAAAQEQLCARGGAVDAVWGGRPTQEAPCFIAPAKARENDYFSIAALLQSMGASLDDASEEPGARETKRYGGLVVQMNIEYSNFHAFHLGAESEVRYVYNLRAVPQTGYKDTRLVSTHFPERREKEDLHGILFTVQATGSLASFDFTSMLLQLTTSLALVAVSTTVVNVLAQYFLTYSPFYRKAMYQQTHDFSDLRAANDLSEEELEGELVGRGLQTSGSRVDQILRLLDHGWVPPPSPTHSTSQLSLQGGERPARTPLVANNI